jgi:hypothetical protein
MTPTPLSRFGGLLRPFGSLLTLPRSVLALVGVVLVPLFATPIIPLTDLGSTVGAAGLLFDALGSSTTASQYYTVSHLPVPYWTGYVWLAVVGFVGGPLFAAKSLVALCVLGPPLAVMRLSRALKRDWSFSLLAFTLAWDVNLYWGWVTFQIGMALAIWALAILIEADSLRAAVRVIPLAIIIALTHAHAVVFLVVAAGLSGLARERPFRSLGLHIVGCLGILVLLPWVWLQVVQPGLAGQGTTELVSPPMQERVGRVFEFSLAVFLDQPGQWFSVISFLVIVAVPLLAGFMPRGSGARSLVALVLFATPVLLYLLLPFEVRGPVPHWWTYPRFATLVLALLLVVPDVVITDRWRVAVAAIALVLTTGLSVARYQQFGRYGDHVRPYVELVEQIPKGSRILPLDIEFAFPGFREPPLGQLHGYAAALRHSYDPHLFDHPAIPLLFRRDVLMPTPDWRNVQSTYTPQMAASYDYVIVHPLTRDFLDGTSPNLQRVADSGAWRLYKVIK